MGIIDESLLDWTFVKEVKNGNQHICRIFKKDVDDKGRRLSSTEINYRVQCFIEGADAAFAFEMVTNAAKRTSWDRRVTKMEDLSKEGNETLKYYEIHS